MSITTPITTPAAAVGDGVAPEGSAGEAHLLLREVDHMLLEVAALIERLDELLASE
jgi:hypothetical protein